MENVTALTIMSEEVLNKKSTQRLLTILRRITGYLSRIRQYGCPHCTDGDCSILSQKEAPYWQYKSLLKSILATREHIPRKNGNI